MYSFAKLEYPQNVTRVWKKDANIPYLQPEHLILTVVTSLVLVFLMLSIIGIYSGRVKPYNKMAVNIIEMIIYCNLVILSAVNLADVKVEVVVYSVSSRIVFVLFSIIFSTQPNSSHCG